MKRFKNTKTRQAFLAIIKGHPQPLNLEEMHSLVSRQIPGLAFSTIYRLAKTLQEEGKITRADWRERGSRYEWADTPHHHHITCKVCGKTADIDDACVVFDTKKINHQTGFKFGDHHIELEGICPQCQRNQ